MFTFIPKELDDMHVLVLHIAYPSSGQINSSNVCAQIIYTDDNSGAPNLQSCWVKQECSQGLANRLKISTSIRYAFSQKVSLSNYHEQSPKKLLEALRQNYLDSFHSLTENIYDHIYHNFSGTLREVEQPMYCQLSWRGKTYKDTPAERPLLLVSEWGYENKITSQLIK